MHTPLKSFVFLTREGSVIADLVATLQGHPDAEPTFYAALALLDLSGLGPDAEVITEFTGMYCF